MECKDGSKGDNGIDIYWKVMSVCLSGSVWKPSLFDELSVQM